MSDDTTTDDEPAQQELAALASALIQRRALAESLGQSWGDLDERDYYDTLGYPVNSELNIQDFWAKFDRGGIAETIVSAPAGQTWNDVPEVDDLPDDPGDDEEETSFQADVSRVFEEHGLLNALDRADTLQRVGQYGILLIGYNDGGDLSEPVETDAFTGDPVDDVLYFQPFSEKDIEDLDRVEDTQDERFAKPETYDVDFGEEGIGLKTVHHSRVLHLAEGALEDEVKGRSALRPIFNYLVDLMKVVGGSAEMYWRDAKKRFIAELSENAGAGVDEDELQDQVEEMVNDLRDVVYSSGGLEMNAIEGGSPDPSGLKDGLLELIAGQTRIPKRRLLGTERGDLASTQDEAAFVGMIEERRRKFAEPNVLRELLQMFIDYGVVDEPREGSYDVEWPDLFELTELEEAERKQRLAKAYKDAASMGDPAEIATTEERREVVLDLPPVRGEGTDAPTGPGGEEPMPGDDVGDGESGVDDVDPGTPDVEEPLDEEDTEVEDWFEEEFGDRIEGAVSDD